MTNIEKLNEEMRFEDTISTYNNSLKKDKQD